MNDHFKEKAIVDRIRDLKINLVCLFETIVNEFNMEAIISRHFQGWHIFHNYVDNGRIWVIWNGVM